MRELILKRIETMRERENDFRGSMMRWKGYYVTHLGLVRPKTKKLANDVVGVRLVDSTKDTFAALDDEALLSTYDKLFRQSCKQM